VWLALERTSKLCNVLFALTLCFEKQILSHFLLFQTKVRANEHDIYKDRYRRGEQLRNRIYWYKMLGISIFIIMTVLLTFIFDKKDSFWLEMKAVITICILGIEGFVTRNYIMTNWQFLSLMKRLRHFEYERHVRNEVTQAVLVTVALCALDLVNLITYAFDESNATGWRRNHQEGFEIC